ncbi:MAG: efflux RND transporter permease subunit [Candidatus Hatepunaea meridiana]|nr:efflux RND transporter permease subunit [Candidatus Hatepunaea meridiana]
MSIIKYSVKNPVIVNIVTVAILLVGTISLIELPRELMPKVSFNWVFVILPFPGVGAEEVEKLLIIPVEDAIHDIDDITTISSEANEGGGFIMVQFGDIDDETFKERYREVETEINAVSLPEGTLDPIIDDFDTDNFLPVISISITGDIPEKQLRDLTEDLRDDILDIKGVSKIALSGVREREIWIEVDHKKLYQHRLSMTQIAGAISSRNLNIPAGTMTVGRESYLLRTIGEVESPDGFQRIVVRWDPNGNHLHLGEIATITDGWERESTRSRLDGKPAATLSISKKGNANSLEVIKKVKEIAENYRDRLPIEARIVFTNDNSIYINDILHKLQVNAQLGFLFVIIILFMFMGLRNSMVAAIGIPIAFMATFTFMYYSGQSFNGNSLFGLILILGVVVDDAIIVIENCFRHRQRGLSRREAAVVGTTEVFSPVISATLTTVAAFLPLILMTGIMGKFMQIVPIVVCLTLVASMVEVFFIAPSHFAEWGGRTKVGGGAWFKRLKRVYTKVLIWIIRRRYLVGPILVLVIVIEIMVIAAGLIPVDFFKGDEFSQFYVYVRMPQGTKLEDTDRIIQRIEREAQALPSEEIHTIIGNAGILQEETDWVFSDNVGQVIVDIVEPELRERTMDEIIEDIRGRIKGIEGPVNIKVHKMSHGPPIGKPIAVKIKGKYFDELEQVADEVKATLQSIHGTYDIVDDNVSGKQEVQIIVDEARASLFGLSVVAIASEVRTAVDGLEVTVFRDGDEEVDVRLKMAGMDESGFEAIRSMMIAAPTGAIVRLDNICDFKTEPTRYRTRRYQRERAITVSANVDKRVTTAVIVNRELKRRFRDISQKHPGYSLDFSGEMKEFEESFAQLGRLFMFGVIIIFTILSAQFKSIRQSLIILLTIPFGFIGSMIGLMIIGEPFSFVTMYGMVALAGIAVNDAIVMVSFINNARAKGESNWRSIIESGRVRLRPIILTSVTTILGLLPMAIGIGGKSESWAPLAYTIIFGLMASTLLTLLVIPTVYSIVVDDWFGMVPIRKRLRKRKERKLAVNY